MKEETQPVMSQRWKKITQNPALQTARCTDHIFLRRVGHKSKIRTDDIIRLYRGACTLSDLNALRRAQCAITRMELSQETSKGQN